MDGDPEASYAHFCLQKYGWPPSKFLDMPIKERAFVIASIDLRAEKERKEQAKLESKMRKHR